MSDHLQRVSAFFDRRAAGFDAIYSGRRAPHLRAWDRLTRRNLFERLEFTLQALEPLAGASVLDVGCGSGRYGVALARRGAARVVGLDVAPRMLAIAGELARAEAVDDRCSVVQSEVTDYRPGRTFDGVVAMGFFDYVETPGEVLAHLRPLTRRRLVASFPARGAFRVPFRRAWLALHGCPVWFYDAGGVRRLCEDAGFRVERLESRGPILLLSAAPA